MGGSQFWNMPPSQPLLHGGFLLSRCVMCFSLISMAFYIQLCPMVKSFVRSGMGEVACGLHDVMLNWAMWPQ